MQDSLTKRESKLSPAKQRILEQRLRGELASADALRHIAPLPRPQVIPLSYAQERLWFIDLLEGGASTEYNMPAALRLWGDLDRQALERAINTIVERHESLRTHFAEVDGEPAQIIEPELRMTLDMEDWTGLDEAAQLEQIQEKLRLEREGPFDLRRGPVIRVKFFKLGERDHVLLRTVHHIVSDGWSEGVFNRELETLYEAYREGKENPLKPLEIQYADFALWQRKWVGKGKLEDGLKYWKKQLEGAPESLELPTDRPRPAVQTFEAEAAQILLPAEQVNGLKRLSQENQATLYMTLMTALAVVLSRYTGQDDLVLGSLIANRQHAQLDSMIGFFLNVLAMRVRLKQGDSFRDLLQEARCTTLEAYQYQDVTFARLVAEIAPERSLNRTPIFQMMFTLQNAPRASERLKALRVERVVGQGLQVRYDIEGHAWELQGQVLLHWAYNRGLFDKWRIKQMMRHHVRVLELAMEDPDRKLSELVFLSPEEKHQILGEWNDTGRELADGTLLDVFETQVERMSDAAALEFEGRIVTYRELNEQANRLAHHLIALGVGPEDLVGICMQRSPEMLVSIFGILKAGAAYLPLDLAYPAERRLTILEDARPLLVLSTGRLRSQLPNSVPVLNIDELRLEAAFKQAGSQNPSQRERRTPLSSRHPAYVIYTSGSTGKPKGVLVEHRGMLNHLWAKIWDLELTSQDTVAQTATFAFDIAVWQMLAALLVGGRVEIMGDELARDGLNLLRALRHSPVTVLEIVPSLLASMLEVGAREAWPDIRHTISTGEALPIETCLRWCNAAKAGKLWNAYGPTECSDDVTHYQTDNRGVGSFEKAEGSAGSVPIGRPICNTRAYVLDKLLHPVPVGVPGELYIAGVGLARGYLKQPGLTSERFVADPFGKPGMRMYRTGDLVRWQRDGNIQYLGRTDHQVKVRGFRIELGDIENALQKIGMRDAAVVVHEPRDREKRLVAYIVPTAGISVDTVEIQTRLAQSLPAYMIPSALVVLDALPLLPNGKLDRKALPAPNYANTVDAYRAPRTPEEEILCALFAEVLELDRVGIDNNFFDLGGHSLMAMRLVSRIRATLGVDLAIRTLFETPSPGELGSRLRDFGGWRSSLVRQQRPERVPLSYSQERMWFLDQLRGGVSTEYSLRMILHLRGALDHVALEKAINTIVERHESLRTRFVKAEGEPVQIIEPELYFPLPITDLSGLPEAVRQEKTAETLRQEWEQPFDLERGPVLRVRLLKLAELEHVLLRTVHHIVSDAWSEGVFNRELEILYEAYREGKENPLKPLEVQYADFTLWQRRCMEEGRLEKGLEYWKKQLEGIPEGLDLPTDRPRMAEQTFEAESCHGMLMDEQVRGLRQLGLENQATLHMTLLTGLGTLLARYSGQDDLVVGSVIANRQDARLDEMIGFFLNILPMRMRIPENKSFRELLQITRRTTLEAYQYQDVSFGRLVEEISPKRALNRTPMFQVAFALQNAPWKSQGMKDLEVERIVGEGLRVRFDLELHVQEGEEKIWLYWLYNRNLFDRWRMEQMMRHFTLVLEAMAAGNSQVIGCLPLLAEAERRQLVYEWNETQVKLPADKCVQELFEEQAEMAPASVAVVFEGLSLRYGELNRRANQLAHYLRGLGVKPDQRVGIYMERGVEMIVALLAVLKAAGAYVPLDIEYPEERLRYMIKDSAPVAILTQRLEEGRKEGVLGESGGRVVDLNADAGQWSRMPENNPGRGEIGLTPHHLAYVIYTSGSTGVPKGVMVTHNNLANYALAIIRRFSLIPGLSYANVSTFAADLGNTVIFPAIMTGGCLHIMSRDRIENPTGLAEYFERERIDVLKIVPAHLAALLNAEAPERVFPRRHLVLGGDSSRLDWVLEMEGMRQDCEIHNHYGPTETTVGVLTYETGRQPDMTCSGTLPIGRPLPNTRIYVLDDRLRPVPIGVRGELWIGGCGVARGYFNRPALTAQKFVADPFSSEPGARVYRTGDRVRYLPGGDIEFLGRMDEQVKIRGYRIEPGEIEVVLCSHPGVLQAAVLLRENDPGDRKLVAFFVPVRPDQPLWTSPCCRLPNGLPVSHLNRNETEYLYREIFVAQAYFRHGITLKDGACVIDTGANIGLFTIFVNRQAHDLRVFAIEPNPSAFECLRANVNAWAPATKCFPIGLSDENKTAEMTVFEGFSFFSGFHADAKAEREVVAQYLRNQEAEAGEALSDWEARQIAELIGDRFKATTIKAQLRTLSAFISEQGIECIDLLKVNVEKSELEVLRGIGSGDWKKIRQIVIEVDQAANVKAIEDLLREHEYTVHVDQEPLLRGTELCYVYALRAYDERPCALQQRHASPLHPVLPPNAEQILTPLVLSEYLKRHLPDPMVPATYVRLDKMPLTANGKVDRKMLPASDKDDRSVRGYEAPQGKLEIEVAGMWAEALKVEAIGRYDNFFQLGGHSLLAVKLMERMRQRGFPVDVRALFSAPTVAELTVAIHSQVDAARIPAAIPQMQKQ